MPYYNDRHTVQWWTPGMFQLHKEKRVVLKCHSYHFKREICSVKLSWWHCLLLLLFFFFPQLTACVVLKLQLQLLVLNGWEHKHICVHTYGGKTGKHKDVIRIAKSLVTVGGCARMMVPGYWQKERFGMKTVPTPRAEPGSAGCPLIATLAWHFHQILPAECLGRAPHCAERRRLLPWFHGENVNASRQWRFELWSVRNVQNCHILFSKKYLPNVQKVMVFFTTAA